MKTILVEGDSTAFGMFDYDGGGWAHRLHTETLAKSVDNILNPTVVVNNALPGKTLPRINQSFPSTILRSSGVRATVLQVGLNEAKIFPRSTRPLIDLKSFGRQLIEFSSNASDFDIPVVFVGPQPVIEEKCTPCPTKCFIEDDLVAEYSEVMYEEASRTDMPYVDTRQLFAPYEMDEVLGADGYHPSSFGHAILHRAVSAALESIDAI